MLAPSQYLAAYRREAAALTAAARPSAASRDSETSRGLEVPIPSCPGWNMATLVSHMIIMNIHRIKLVALRPERFLVRGAADMDLPDMYRDWFDGRWEAGDLAVLPPGLPELYERTTEELGRVLWALEPAEPVWSWWPAEQTAGFWQRRMAHETAVHRWDAQMAHGAAEPIEAELASDGIDETFEVMLPARREWATEARPGAGEVYHFHRTDGPGEWLVRFAPDGPVVTREHGRGDVAVRGPASDLFLFLWQRIPAERLEVFGDASLLARYFELAPPD